MKYNTMFDVGFTVDHSYDDPNDVPPDVLVAALEKRAADLRKLLSIDPQAVIEAFGACDTYTHDEIVQG